MMILPTKITATTNKASVEMTTLTKMKATKTTTKILMKIKTMILKIATVQFHLRRLLSVNL